jgi:hypothetical protein
MKSNKYNVAIIGLGNIGGGYNFDKNEFSHANCVKKSDRFNLRLGIDNSYIKRKNFEKRFKCFTTNNINNLKNYKVDTVIISTPTNTHLNLVKKVLKIKNIKILILEKPCGKNFKETEKIINLCKEYRKVLLVNYQRIFNPKWLIFQKILKNQKITGTFHYSRGFKNNCSHVISFLINSGFTKLNLTKIKGELILKGKNIELYFIRNKKKNYYINEGQFFTNNHRILSFNSFNYLKIYKKEKDPSFKTMINFNRNAEEYDTEYKIKDNLNFKEFHRIISLKKHEKFYNIYKLTSKITDKVR